MEESLGVMIPLAGVILSLSIPIVAIIMVFMTVMNKKKHDKEVRQLIIENHTDAETAKLLIDEPKKAKKPGTIDLGTLRTACMLLGVGLGAGIDWLADVSTKSIYFWLIVAFGVGIGMLCSFLVELRLAKKQHPTEDNWKDE
jgi:NADH:ubiquinone oxidoreductase subunit 5 (subunit L)/multisubunit Na+/H+ antiporter MnhA subunit